MVDRVSTYALFQSTLRDSSQVQANLATLQTQLSSGFKSSNFEGIAAQTDQFLSLDNQLSRSSVYQTNNQVLETRIDSTNSALDQIVSTATDLKNLILQRRNASSGIAGPVFQQQLNSSWQLLTQSLNTSLQGRYLFSGDKTDTPPVNSTTFPTLAQAGVPDDGYYQGGNQDLTVQIDDGVNMTYNVRANAPGFQKIFAGLAMAQKGDTDGSDDELSQAYTLVQDGLSDVIATQATVNTNKLAVGQVTTRQQGLQLYWQGLKEDIGNTDMVAASTQVAINQGILQASFQAFAKINSLRLSDYLH